MNWQFIGGIVLVVAGYFVSTYAIRLLVYSIFAGYFDAKQEFIKQLSKEAKDDTTR